MDLKQFYKGQAFDAYQYFGAHREYDQTVFRLYAPNAHGVCVVGEFTSWQEQPLRQLGQSGVWEGWSPWAAPGQMYKYVVYGPNGRVEHCDPYGFGMELRPGACSIIRELSEYRFTDGAWMRKRRRSFDKPVNIYELHFGSWKHKEGGWWYGYEEMADQLIPYLREHNYNYVEFMPLSEHPFDGSWGYQNTGFFSPTSRYGTAAQLMALIDRLHHAEIGVIMDFVPVHFAVDHYGLRQLDGTALYEYPNRDVGESEWGSYNFNHARGEVASFLQSAANYWLKEYHVDGLRMDAVSRLIYWQGDQSRGENTCAIRFLQRMNQGLHKRHPTAMLIAEDSTAYPGVTKPVKEGGLGFDYKWDLGWMHDTLEYLKCHPHDRAGMPEKLTFSIYYAWQERYILPFSHDEVVHGKKTILDKLYGDYEEKFAQARLLYLYMMTHPGKKLNFMGNELAMFREWDERRQPDWELLAFPAHDGFHRYILELNQLYQKKRALWERDHSWEGFAWLDCGCENKCVFGYVRRAKRSAVAVFFNFSDREAVLSPRLEGKLTLLLDTQWQSFGGQRPRRRSRSLIRTLPPFGGAVYSVT